MVDSGADISIVPLKLFQPDNTSIRHSLVTANNGKINVFGEKKLTLIIPSIPGTFTWTFTVADVRRPILGSDFLSNFKLLVDCHNTCIIKKQMVIMNTEKQTCLRIETSGTPVNQKVRRLGGVVYNQIKKEFEDMLNQEIIQPSDSEWASPLVIIKKKDGTFRPCGDYRMLNACTKPDRYPLPRMSDILEKVTGCTFFSTFDLKKAYHQIPINEEDRHKTAIITPFGLFEYKQMPFGLKNASQTFQRHMDNCLQDCREFTSVYIDDILVYSKSPDEHQKHLQIVKDVLLKNKLQVNSEKCQINKSEVDFLGFTISSKGIKPIKSKIDAISNMSVPKTFKSLRRFIGTMAFYQWMIPNLSKTMSPLHDLITASSKNRALRWLPIHEEAFRIALKKLTEIVDMATPNYSKTFVLCTDASGTAIGGSLNHESDDGRLCPISFFSRKLNHAEKRYSTFDRELLALVLSIKHFNHYLLGSKFIVRTDHKPLLHIMQMKNQSGRQWRWTEFLSQYDMQIQFIKGSENIVADFLSRKDADDEILKEVEHISLSDLVKSQKDYQFIKDIQSHSLKLKTTKEGVLVDTSKSNTRIALPECFRFNEFERLHNLCHQGSNATIRLISSRYVWPGMRAEIRKWCRFCQICQANKITRHTKSPLGSIPNLGKFKVLHIDLVGPLPSIKNKRFILTMIDRDTSWTEVVPLNDITSESVIKALTKEWISRFGVPEIIVSDNGRQFISEVFSNFCESFGIEHRHTTPYHPQCNGKVERFHRSLKNALRSQGTNAERNWLENLPLIMLGIRNAVGEDSELSPSQTIYGTTIRLPGDIVLPSHSDGQTRVSTEFQNSCLRSHGITKTFMPKGIDKCKFVWIKRETRRPLQPVYEGPYRVSRRNEDGKVIEVIRRGRTERISIDKIRPAFILHAPSFDGGSDVVLHSENI